jgi:hypothetical protein
VKNGFDASPPHRTGREAIRTLSRRGTAPPGSSTWAGRLGVLLALAAAGGGRRWPPGSKTHASSTGENFEATGWGVGLCGGGGGAELERLVVVMREMTEWRQDRTSKCGGSACGASPTSVDIAPGGGGGPGGRSGEWFFSGEGNGDFSWNLFCFLRLSCAALRAPPPFFFWEDLPPPAQQIADYEIDDADADVDWQIGMGV